MFMENTNIKEYGCNIRILNYNKSLNRGELMLKKLRHKKTAKKIWIVLIVLIVPAFIFWGFGSFMRSRQESSYAGIIYGKKITSLEYKDALDAVRNQAIIQFGNNLSEIEKNLNLESQAWERLILLAEAKKRKISANDIEVVELIQSYPFFQTKKGRFDSQIYSQMLQYVFRSQPRIFEEQTRQNLIISKLYKTLTQGLNVTDATVKQEYKKINEQLDLYYIAGIPADFAKNINTSEQDLKDYFAKNSFKFKQPVSFNIEYLTLPSQGKDKEAIEDKIKKLFWHLNKRENFAKVAKDFNLETKETGFFSQTDPIPGIGWSPQVFSLIAKLKTGEFSPPIRMDEYYYILRLKEKRESYIPDFAMIKDTVKEGFIKDKSREVTREKVENCLKKIKELSADKPHAADFEKAARACGLESKSTGMFKYGGYIEGVGTSDTFFTAAQGLKENAASEIIDLPSGFYIVKVKTRIPIDEEKFRQDKAGFAERLLVQKKVEYFSRLLEELKRKAQVF